MEQERLFELLAKSLAYTGVVYKQSTYPLNQGEFDNVFTFEFKHGEIPDDSVLFFLPAVSSNGGGCTLRVRVPFADGGSVSYTNVDLPISVETTEGVIRPAGTGDIIANRLCIFRFNLKAKRAILVNSPVYGEASFSTLRVTDATFSNVPKVKNDSLMSGYSELATVDQVARLAERVAALEGKILFGTESPDEVLADKPAGTIYIQVQGD